MKKFVFAILGLGLLITSPLFAQEPISTPGEEVGPAPASYSRGEVPEQIVSLSQSVVEPTTEMWFYQQEKRDRLDPSLAVRRNAEYKAAQRRYRLAAMRWFGYSNLRPAASPDPINGYYSPFWAGNNQLSPYMWSGNGHATVVAQPGPVYR